MTKTSLLKFLFFTVLLVSFTPLRAQTFIEVSLRTPGNAGILSESCGGPYELVFERAEDNVDTTFIFISDLGDALSNIDYTFPAGSFPIEMLPADTLVVVPVNVINEGSPEGFESLIWEIAFLAGLESGAINLESGIVDDYEVEILSATDTIQWCRNVPLNLSATSVAEIHWSPASAFEDSIGSDVTVIPFLSSWYYAEVGDDDCGASDSVYIDLAIAEITDPDTVFICLDGDGATLHGNLDGLATTFKWIPADTTLSNPNILTPIANPVVTTTYILQSDFGICIASDTVVVRVDSLPGDMHIDIAPFKAYYCAGEIVALFSPSYDSLDFPDIQFAWIPNNATFKTPTTLYNAALELQDTTLYLRETTNNACTSRDSILINVVPPSVPLSVTDTMLCPGEMFTVSVLSTQVIEPEWTPEDGLSCTKCLSPKVTVIGIPGDIKVYMFSGMILECPVGATLTINIPPLQQINIVGDEVACEGDMVPLTISNPAGLTNLNWTIQSGPGSLSCTNCPDPVVTINGDESVNVEVTANTTNTAFCGAFGSYQIKPGLQPQISGPPIQACLGETAVASTGNPAYTNPHWDVISGDLILSCTECDNPEVTVNSLSGVLRFFADYDGEDTCGVVGSVSVSVFDEDISELTLTPDPNVGPIGQGAQVTVLLGVTPTPTGPVTWIVNGVQIGGTGTTIQFNADEDINFIEATFINSHGCEQMDTISFTTVPPTYKIPNAFTPGGDGLNDNFKIILIGNIVVEKFLIFNRWGQKVYEAEDDVQGWDGSFKNQPAASDTYVYTATLRFPDGRTEVAKGDVMLLR